VGDPARLRQFQREARAASALSHPNILTVYELGDVEGMPFIASELVEGPTLTELIAARRLTTDELLDTAIQVAEAVAEAHERGIVHCDLKPSNIMLTRHGLVKVLDFGLAQLMVGVAGPDPALGRTIGDSGVFRRHGTPGYMSPEQLAMGPADPRNDVYSLGAVLYEMATGQLPVDDESPPRTSDVENAQDSRQPLAGRPAELVRIIRRCLARKSDDRYPNGRGLAVDLERMRRRRARRRLLHKPLLFSAGLVVVVAVLLGWLLRPAPRVIGDQVPSFSPSVPGMKT
jgi:serine/threonine protein kinase